MIGSFAVEKNKLCKLFNIPGIDIRQCSNMHNNTINIKGVHTATHYHKKHQFFQNNRLNKLHSQRKNFSLQDDVAIKNLSHFPSRISAVLKVIAKTLISFH